MTGAGEAPRRVHRRRAGGAPLLVALAGVLALVLTLAALRSEPSGARVVVAARDLTAGTRLRPADVRYERVRSGDEVLAHLVRADSTWRGRVLVHPVPAGEPLTPARLVRTAGPAGRRAMSIPVARARAVNGHLVAGDRVDVVRARDGVATVVAAALEVLDVDDDHDGALGSARGEVAVTLAVDVAESQRLAAVLADGEFVLTRVTGAASADGAPPVVLDDALTIGVAP